MKVNRESLKTILLIDLIVILSIVIVIPFILDVFGLNIKILVISLMGNILIISTIVIIIIDLLYLLLSKRNVYLLSSLSMTFTISLFLLLEYCFLNDYYDFVYVWSYSKSTLPIVFKIVAIWAGEAGSIMTWMLFMSIIIFFYRLHNQNRNDTIFIISVIISLLISLVFLVILLFFTPFATETPFIFPNGRGLNPLLISPFMIWHPLFTFIAYAIFLIPFTISIIEVIKPKKSLENPYQKSFYDFSMKFGWFVLTVGIGLGAYWAKIALTWGRYWGWDPVETVSLVPWFFSTAYFHTKTFKKKNERLVKINIISVFLSIIFSTLITRGGGLSSLHAFTGDNNLVTWTLITGSALIIFSLYVVYNSLNSMAEEYKKRKLFLDYLSYLFLFMLAFVCVFGLFITPLTSFLSNFFSLNVIFVGTDFFIITTLILASGLAISLIFCSLYGIFKSKWITVTLGAALIIQSIISLVIFLLSSIWINPVITIFSLSFLTSIFKLIKDFDSSKGIKHFFRINSKTYVHTGLSLILIGTLIDPEAWFFQDIFLISGFIFLVIGIIPSIFLLLILRKNRE
ncbi:MAG: cytochrome c biogenesis protein CcsA [Promethearchaeota archaeon]|jgi:cytochrome c-type biogenesis protein CcmF